MDREMGRALVSRATFHMEALGVIDVFPEVVDSCHGPPWPASPMVCLDGAMVSKAGVGWRSRRARSLRTAGLSRSPFVSGPDGAEG